MTASEETWVYTACPGWGDHDHCALKTIIKDGRIVRTEKAIYSDPEADEGHICQKGILACRQPYNPDRLTTPLKRIGKRGEGKWEKITWDQALDEIAAKLDEIRKESGSNAVCLWDMPASVPPQMGLIQQLSQRFIGVFGATDPVGSLGQDNGPLFSGYYDFGSEVLAILDPRRIIGANMVIVWGCNPVENQMRCAMNLVRAREAGARIVDIGLVFDGTAGLADEFVGPAAGSDAYLALAMANYIVKNGLENKSFVINHTVAPYLVDTGTGKLARRGADYLVWDEATGAVSAVAPSGGVVCATSPALLGSFDVDGITVVPAWQLLVDHLAKYTLELAESVTRVPAADIARLAREYATVEKATIIAALGMRYKNQGNTYRAIDLLAILCGRMGEQGNAHSLVGTFTCYPVAGNDKAVTIPDGLEGSKARLIKMEQFFMEAQQETSPYRAFICTSGNPLHNQPDRNRWMRVFDNMELVVDFDIWLTDTGEMSDYVLPDCMPFERTDILNSGDYNHVVLQEPAIEPPEQVKTINYFLSGLANRLGLPHFDKTDEEYIDMFLDTDYPPIATLEPKLTYERLKKEKMVRMNVPEEPWFDGMAGLQFPSPTGKCEFYAERLADLGMALATYTPVHESPVIPGEGSDKYPYQLFTGRQRWFMQSMFTDDPINVALSGGKPTTRMNPRDAKERGFVDGEKIEVFNDRGHVVTPLELDESIPPGTLHVWFGWRKRDFEEGMYAECVTPICGPGIADDLAQRWLDNWLEDGGTYNAGYNLMAVEVGTWDAFWDCAADIRKWDNNAAGKEA